MRAILTHSCKYFKLRSAVGRVALRLDCCRSNAHAFEPVPMVVSYGGLRNDDVLVDDHRKRADRPSTEKIESIVILKPAGHIVSGRIILYQLRNTRDLAN